MLGSSKDILAIITVALFAAINAAPGRTTIPLDEKWSFALGEQAGAELLGYSNNAWRILDLPHDWSIEGHFDKTNPGGGSVGFLPTGIGWYRKTFDLPNSYSGKKIFVQFDGAYMNSEVWINGFSLGKRSNGSISFNYDLTGHLNFGAGKSNLIAVRVDNSLQPSARWYTGSGINRRVRLLVMDPLHLDLWGPVITTVKLAPDSATLRIVTDLYNEGAQARKISVITKLMDATGREVVNSKSETSISACNRNLPGERQVVQEMEVKSALLWSTESPNLYKAVVEVHYGDQIVDSVDTTIGIRMISVDVKRGFLINGTPVKIKGVCLHSDCGALGTTFYANAWRRRLQTLKEIGCNAVRTAHNPQDPGFYDLCDQMGILVMDEDFDQWVVNRPGQRYQYGRYFQEWYERDLRDRIRRDRNHPSVVIWSLGNEIWGSNTFHGQQALETMAFITRQEDRTRPVVVSGGGDTRGILDMEDMHYEGILGSIRDQIQLRAGQTVTEPKETLFFTADGVVKGGQAAETTQLKERCILGGEAVPSPSEWFAVNENSFAVGEFIWTGIDYIGETGLGFLTAGANNCRGSNSGLLDLAGFMKPSAYYYQALWTEKPTVYIACQLPEWDVAKMDFWDWPRLESHWTWPGEEGKTIKIFAYSNCDSVELFLNGISLGSKPISKDLQSDCRTYMTSTGHTRLYPDKPLWEVPYQPGKLVAVGLQNGNKVCQYELATASEPARIQLTADQPSITTDDEDVALVNVEIVDKNGVVVPSADTMIDYTISNGTVMGVENGDNHCIEDYKAMHHSVFNGRCLAYVGSRGPAGEITLTAAAKGLESASVTIRTSASP